MVSRQRTNGSGQHSFPVLFRKPLDSPAGGPVTAMMTSGSDGRTERLERGNHFVDSIAPASQNEGRQDRIRDTKHVEL